MSRYSLIYKLLRIIEPGKWIKITCVYPNEPENIRGRLICAQDDLGFRVTTRVKGTVVEVAKRCYKERQCV